MHELHLAQDILEKTKESAKAKGLAKISRVKVRLGEARFSDLPELKEILSTISQDIQFDIEIIPVKAVCEKCNQEFNSKTPRLDCPHCGATNISITSGQELTIEELK